MSSRPTGAGASPPLDAAALRRSFDGQDVEMEDHARYWRWLLRLQLAWYTTMTYLRLNVALFLAVWWHHGVLRWLAVAVVDADRTSRRWGAAVAVADGKSSPTAPPRLLKPVLAIAPASTFVREYVAKHVLVPSPYYCHFASINNGSSSSAGDDRMPLMFVDSGPSANTQWRTPPPSLTSALLSPLAACVSVVLTAAIFPGMWLLAVTSAVAWWVVHVATLPLVALSRVVSKPSPRDSVVHEVASQEGSAPAHEDGTSSFSSLSTSESALLDEFLADVAMLHASTHSQSVDSLVLRTFSRQASLLRGQPVSHRTAFQLADSDEAVPLRLQRGDPIDVTYGEACVLVQLLSEVFAWEMLLTDVVRRRPTPFPSPSPRTSPTIKNRSEPLSGEEATAAVRHHHVALLLSNTPEYDLFWLAVARSSGLLTLLAAMYAAAKSQPNAYHHCAASLLPPTYDNACLFHALTCTASSILVIEESFAPALFAPPPAPRKVNGSPTSKDSARGNVLRLNVPACVKKVYVWRGTNASLVPTSEGFAAMEEKGGAENDLSFEIPVDSDVMQEYLATAAALHGAESHPYLTEMLLILAKRNALVDTALSESWGERCGADVTNGSAETMVPAAVSSRTTLELCAGRLKAVYEELRRADDDASTSLVGTNSTTNRSCEHIPSSAGDALLDALSTADAVPHHSSSSLTASFISSSVGPPSLLGAKNGQSGHGGSQSMLSPYQYLAPLIRAHPDVFFRAPSRPTGADTRSQVTDDESALRSSLNAAYSYVRNALLRLDLSYPLLYLFTVGKSGASPKCAALSHLRAFASLHVPADVLELRSTTASLVRSRVEQRWLTEKNGTATLKRGGVNPADKVPSSPSVAGADLQTVLRDTWMAVEVEKELSTLTVYNVLPRHTLNGSVTALGILLRCLSEQQHAGEVMHAQSLLADAATSAKIHSIPTAAGPVLEASGSSLLWRVVSGVTNATLFIPRTAAGFVWSQVLALVPGSLAQQDGAARGSPTRSPTSHIRIPSYKRVPTPTARVVLRTTFNAAHFRADMETHRATVTTYTGDLARLVLHHHQQRAQSTEISPVKSAGSGGSEGDSWVVPYACGRGLGVEIWESMERVLRVSRIVEYYNATESHVMLINQYDIPGAVGHLPVLPYGLGVFALTSYPKLFPYNVVAMDFNACDAGATPQPLRNARSQLCEMYNVRDPGQLVGNVSAGASLSGLQRYAGGASRVVGNVRATGDAYFLTGDLVRVDDVGLVYFADRMINTYCWKGKVVYAAEVAAAIPHATDTHPSIAITRATVYGVPIGRGEGKAGMAKLTLVRKWQVAPSQPGSALPRRPPLPRPAHISMEEEQSFMLNDLYGLLASSKCNAWSLPSYAIPTFIRVDASASPSHIANIATRQPARAAAECADARRAAVTEELISDGYAVGLANDTMNGTRAPMTMNARLRQNSPTTTTTPQPAPRIYVLVTNTRLLERMAAVALKRNGIGCGYVPLTAVNMPIFGDDFSACGW